MNKLQLPKRSADEIRFAEYMGGFFHDFLRAAGITMTQGNTMERVRSIGEKMGKAIGDQAEKKAIQIIEQLQDSVVEGFLKMEASFTKVKELLQKSSAAVLNLLDDQKQAAAHIKDLQERLRRLESNCKADDFTRDSKANCGQR